MAQGRPLMWAAPLLCYTQLDMIAPCGQCGSLGTCSNASLSKGAGHDAGYQLDKVQRGHQPADVEPMAGIGNGVERFAFRALVAPAV